MLGRLRERGLPNVFGAQRFGHGGENLARSLSFLDRGGRGARHFEVRLWTSVVQAEAFNRYVALRASHGLDRPLEGEVVRLDGSRATFVVESVEREAPRLASGDVHLTGPMVGPKMRAAAGVPLELERRAFDETGLDATRLGILARHVDGTRRDVVVRPPG